VWPHQMEFGIVRGLHDMEGSRRRSTEPLRLAVFDFDGTLVDTHLDIAVSVNLMLKDLSVPPRSVEEITSFVGRGVQSLIRDVLGDEDKALLDRALKLFKRHYKEHCLDQTCTYPHVKDVLREIPVRWKAIVTNKPQTFTEIIVSGLGLERFFDRILGGDAVPKKKPAPDPIHVLIDEFNISPNAVIMIGDSPLDIQMGRAAGIRTCAVTYGYGMEDALKSENPDFLISDFIEIRKIIR